MRRKCTILYSRITPALDVKKAMYPDRKGTVVDKPASTTKLGKALDIPDHDHMNYLGFSLALLDALSAAAEIFMLEVGVAGALGTATALGTVLTVGLPVLGMFANFLNLGGPYADATDFHVKKQMASGYSKGAVLGALRKNQEFVPRRSGDLLKHGPRPPLRGTVRQDDWPEASEIIGVY